LNNLYFSIPAYFNVNYNLHCHIIVLNNYKARKNTSKQECIYCYNSAAEHKTLNNLHRNAKQSKKLHFDLRNNWLMNYNLKHDANKPACIKLYYKEMQHGSIFKYYASNSKLFFTLHMEHLHIKGGMTILKVVVM